MNIAIYDKETQELLRIVTGDDVNPSAHVGPNEEYKEIEVDWLPGGYPNKDTVRPLNG